MINNTETKFKIMIIAMGLCDFMNINFIVGVVYLYKKEIKKMKGGT